MQRPFPVPFRQVRIFPLPECGPIPSRNVVLPAGVAFRQPAAMPFSSPPYRSFTEFHDRTYPAFVSAR